MKIYKVYTTEYCGGMGESSSHYQIGMFVNKEKAIAAAKKVQKEQPKFKEIVIGHHINWTDLKGNKASYPFDGVVIEELYVEE